MKYPCWRWAAWQTTTPETTLGNHSDICPIDYHAPLPHPAPRQDVRIDDLFTDIKKLQDALVLARQGGAPTEATRGQIWAALQPWEATQVRRKICMFGHACPYTLMGCPRPPGLPFMASTNHGRMLRRLPACKPQAPSHHCQPLPPKRWPAPGQARV
jgi:hypothetical protein